MVTKSVLVEAPAAPATNTKGLSATHRTALEELHKLCTTNKVFWRQATGPRTAKDDANDAVTLLYVPSTPRSGRGNRLNLALAAVICVPATMLRLPPSSSTPQRLRGATTSTSTTCTATQSWRTLRR